MRVIPRLLLVALLVGGLFVYIKYVRHLQGVVDAAHSDPASIGTTEETTGYTEEEIKDLASKIPYYEFGFLGLGAVTAVVSCVVLLPLLGEIAGSFIFTPNEQIERSPHADALAKLAAGDFQGAIDEYKDVFDDNPQDLHAASEIVRLYCEKLHQPEPASDFLVEALSYPDRPMEETAFLSQRQVDVCWGVQRDAIRARAILIKIAEDMPETREAANALHRLQEIERALHDPSFGGGGGTFGSELPLVPGAKTESLQGGDAAAPEPTKAPEA